VPIVLIFKKLHFIDKKQSLINKIDYIYLKNIRIMDTYKFDGGEVAMIESNILLIEYESSKLITTRNIFNLKKMRERILGNQMFYTITDLRNGLLSLTDEAKLYISEENDSSTNRVGDAILVNSLAKKIEAELYIIFNKPKVKTKIFTNLNKAICWLNTLKVEKAEYTH